MDHQGFRNGHNANCLLVKAHNEEDKLDKQQIHKKLDELQALLTISFTLEGLGETSHHHCKSSEDQRAEKIILPDSGTNDYKGLISIETNMKRDPEYTESCKTQVENFIDKGTVRATDQIF